MCILFGISRFWLKEGVLVILDSRAFWSFGEQGLSSLLVTRIIFSVLNGNHYFTKLLV